MTETEISLSFPHFAGKFSIGKNRSARGKNAHHIGLFGFSTFYTETTSYYFYLFFLFYIILRESRKNFKKAHARRVEKVAGIDRFEEQTRSALPQNYQQIIKNKFFDTSSVSLRLPPFSLRLGHARVLTALGLSFIPLAPLRYPLEKACSTSVSAGTFQCQHHYFDPRGSP